MPRPLVDWSADEVVAWAKTILGPPDMSGVADILEMCGLEGDDLVVRPFAYPSLSPDRHTHTFF